MQLSALTASLGRFLAELQRRKVLRIAAGYVVGAWIVLQVALALQTAMSLSGQFSAAILALLVIGFFVTLVLAWFYEITPEGVKRTAPATGDAPLVKPQTTDLALAGALALVVIVALVQLFTSTPTAPPATAPTTTAETTPAKPAPPALGDKSIAVLPFANLSPDKDDAYFADGLTEELLNLLAKIGDLKVISRTSSFAFKGKNTPLPEIAKTLGVRHIVEGSVRSDGNELRVTAQLIDVSTDTHLWSQSYERKIDNIFALQDEIARRIAETLSVEVTLSSSSRDAPTKNMKAYRLYLEGLSAFRNRDADLADVIDRFKRAIAADPKFAEPYAMLAMSYSLLMETPLGPASEETRLARAAATAAVELKPTLGLSYAVLGRLDRHAARWEAAADSFAKAVALDPSNSYVRTGLGNLQVLVGRLREAKASFTEALRTDPLLDSARGALLTIETVIGTKESAEKLALGLTSSPDTPTAGLAHYYLAGWAYDRGDGQGAAEHYLAFLRPSDRDQPFANAMVRALRTGKGKDAAVKALMAEIKARPAAWSITGLIVLKADDALLDLFHGYFAASAGSGVSGNLGVSMWDPRTRALRQDPRWKDVLRLIGLVDYWKKHGWPDRCRPKGEDDFECS